MKNFSSLAKALSATALLSVGVSNAVNAATITFGGDDADDFSGLTSTYIDPISGGLPDYFIETFDLPAEEPEFPGESEYTIEGFEGVCGVNSVNDGPTGVILTADTSEVGIRKGSVANVAAAPLDDTTCYGYATNNGSGVATLEFDYNQLLDFYSDLYGADTQIGITYLGFYWGSVDTYNDFAFYSNNTLVTEIKGSELLAGLEDVQSGDQTDPATNVYVNIDFSIAEQFDTLVITTRGIAGEFDNIVIGLSTREIPVPAPTGLALFAFGLVALGLRSRLKK